MADVELVKHNEAWSRQYIKEKKSITQAIPDSFIDIEHIGSTVIPEIKAKPIIDIMAGIAELEEYVHLVAPLEKAGYVYIPKQEFTDRKFFLKRIAGNPDIHLHICEMNGTEWNDKLFFRDYLRSNRDKRSAYEVLKMRLANEYRNDRSSYTKAKESFIHDVLRMKRQHGLG
ncbi:GrpB family protein [Virgibacillus doumboii]|uniref:GrpB family protein n=1 Tax=Virgibacillus doumboii TaxID=2697503 RepID=UPI0013E0893E|nr:GrpB family protein [Virgibacillus doumboii]